MTVMTELRAELKNHAADSQVAKLLNWAELQFGDLHAQIEELEEECAEFRKREIEQDNTLAMVGEAC